MKKEKKLKLFIFNNNNTRMFHVALYSSKEFMKSCGTIVSPESKSFVLMLKNPATPIIIDDSKSDYTAFRHKQVTVKKTAM